MGRNKKLIKFGKISGKDDILTAQEKTVAFIDNKKNKPWNESMAKIVRVKTVEGGQDED